MIKTVLVAVDGSDHAKKALSLAADIAAKYKARMVLVHALMSNVRSETLRKLANRRALSKQQRDLLDNYEVDTQMAMAEAGAAVGFVPIPAPRELLELVGRQVLERAEAAAAKAGVKKVSSVLAGGDPADAILETAKREKADMIVLGSRGLGDLKGFFLGSVSHKVSAHAACTCVTVK
jgi:nucleotide-binding universal stress UspA family protein